MSDTPSILNPIGIIPERVWWEHRKRERLLELAGAINRYASAYLPLRQEWIDEYHRLCNEFNPQPRSL